MSSTINHRGMRPVGVITKFQDLKAIADAIYGRDPTFQMPSDNTLCWVRTMANGQVRGVFYAGKRYLQQNPGSKSTEAQRVREQGARIIWVIKDDGTYVGKMEDGMVYIKESLIPQDLKSQAA